MKSGFIDRYMINRTFDFSMKYVEFLIGTFFPENKFSHSVVRLHMYNFEGTIVRSGQYETYAPLSLCNAQSRGRR